jgi:hypothetical protein
MRNDSDPYLEDWTQRRRDAESESCRTERPFKPSDRRRSRGQNRREQADTMARHNLRPKKTVKTVGRVAGRVCPATRLKPGVNQTTQLAAPSDQIASSGPGALACTSCSSGQNGPRNFTATPNLRIRNSPVRLAKERSCKRSFRSS